MQTDVLLVTYTVLLPTNPCCSITELLRHPASRAFLSLVRFWCIPKRNGVRSLWSMPSIFLGYSFEPKRSSHSLTTVGSVMTIGLSINRSMLAPEKTSLMRENKIDYSPEVCTAATSKALHNSGTAFFSPPYSSRQLEAVRAGCDVGVF